MKKKITLPISKSAKILIKAGDLLGPGTKIAEEDIIASEETINLSMILSVPPKQIHKFLKVSLGQRISTGEVLAVKKSIFSSVTIKSPMNGIIKSVDLNKGMIIIGGENTSNESIVISSISGKVEHIEDGYIEVSIEGSVIKAEEGKGEEATAEGIVMEKAVVGSFDAVSDVNDKILICRSIEKDTEVKLEVLGAKGYVVLNNPENTALPWVRIKKEDYENLIKKEKIHLWIRPGEKEMVIFS